MTHDISSFIEKFYCKHYKKLYTYAFSILRHRMDAEAAVQEAFAAACESPAELMNSENPVGWMKKAVKFRALQLLDERKHTDALLLTLTSLNPGVNLSAQDGADTELELLCQAIVSKDEFDFFLRLALGATTFIEESKRLHIKLPACYKRFERIRDKLQRSIGKYYKHE